MSHPDPLYDQEWESYCDEQANREIFRDQCRSTVEDNKLISEMLQMYWQYRRYSEAAAFCLGIIIISDDPHLMIEMCVLRDLIIWRESL
jgi:hypothetical protein